MARLIPVMLVGSMVAMVCFIFAAAIPGTWWQWLALAFLFVIAGAVVSVAQDSDP